MVPQTFALAGLLLCTPLRVPAQSGLPAALQTAAQIRQLTPAQAARHYPVHLRGTLTFFDQSQFFRFVQDRTAGIYFFLPDSPSTNAPGLKAGDWVAIDGMTSPGEYAPIVTPQRIRVLGKGDYPAAKPVTFQDLVSGAEDSQFVEIHGIVRSVQWDNTVKYYLLNVATGGGRLTVFMARLPVRAGESLVDSTVGIRGVCAGRFNLQRQLFDTRLLVPRPEDFTVESPAPAIPFAIPERPMEQLLQFAPQGTYGHRVKVAGTVIYREGDDVLYIEDKTEGLYVETKQPGVLRPGDRVEVLGFPAQGDYSPVLQDAFFRQTGSGPPPTPDAVTADEALTGKT